MNIIHEWTDLYDTPHRLVTVGGGVEEQMHSEQDGWHVATKRHSDAVNELVKVLERQAWQPIETAPKDGTRCLFYIPEDDETGYLESMCVTYFNGDELERYNIMQLEDGLEPTHWMPLAEPPKEETR